MERAQLGLERVKAGLGHELRRVGIGLVGHGGQHSFGAGIGAQAQRGARGVQRGLAGIAFGLELLDRGEHLRFARAISQGQRRTKRRQGNHGHVLVCSMRCAALDMGERG